MGDLTHAQPSSEPLLSLRSFGVAFGDNVVLRGVNLDVGRVGATSLMGPGGAGKSTLVRTLAGHNDAQPLLRVWGVARYQGRPLASDPRPFLLAQSARLMIASVLENVAIGFADRHLLTQRDQRDRAAALLDDVGLGALSGSLDARVIDLPLGAQRAVAIARAVAARSPLVLLDEPTVGLEDDARLALLRIVAREAERRAILLVTHNRDDAQRLGGRVALLVGGRVAEVAPCAELFAAPRSAVARHFVETGTCYLDPLELELGAGPLDEDDAVETPRPTPPPATATTRPPSSARVAIPRTPRGFHWVRRGVLAGMPRPGLLVEIEEDLAGLYGLGVGALVSLEETRTVPEALLAEHEIESIWEPIRDMAAPTIERARALCAAIHERVSAGVPVAVHCRAGLGRTGTILAAYLIWEGRDALEALEGVRCVQPRFVQSDEQIAFLSELARACRDAGRPHDAAPAPHASDAGA